MPPLPAVPNVVKASLDWTISSDVDARTGLFFEYSGSTPSNAACTALAGDVYAAFAANNGDWDHDTSLVGCTVIDLSSSSGGVGVHSGSVPGSLATPISGASAVLANYLIARRYRGGRPRSYFPFGDASVVGNRQTWEASFITGVTTHLAAAFAACIGSTSGGTTLSQHANVSYYDGTRVVISPTTGRARNVPILRATPLVDTIVGFSVATRIANQRRRG